MEKQQAQELIAKALEQVRKKPVEFTEQTHLVDDKILDSLDRALFFFELENLAGISIPDEKIAVGDLFSIANLYKFLGEV